MTTRGRAIARSSRRRARAGPLLLEADFQASFKVTNAMITCPVVASLAPTTAASATLGWSTSADSTSVVETRWPRHVHDIVDPPEQPKVPVVVDLGPVACEVATSKRLQYVCRYRSGSRRCPATWPARAASIEVPAAAFELPAGVVDDLGPDPRQREGRTSRLQGRDAGQRRDHDGTGLGLPPRVDDRAAAPPICCQYQIHASGLIGSPTEPSIRRLDRSCAAGYSVPHFMKCGWPSAPCTAS